VAELDLLDAASKPISYDGWTIAYVDSEERASEDGSAENAIDGQTADFRHTEWSAAQPNYPHKLALTSENHKPFRDSLMRPARTRAPGPSRTTSFMSATILSKNNHADAQKLVSRP
jgi:hypothetical protein